MPMKTNELYNIAEKNNIEIKSFKLSKIKSTSISIGDDYYIGIDEKNIETTAEERTHLAHELGHCMTGSFYNMYSEYDIRAKHEYRADKWAVLHLIPKDKFISLLKKGYRIWELAEYFEVTEDFIRKAYHLYFDVKMVMSDYSIK